MERDEHIPRRPDPRNERRPEPGGWEEQAGAQPGWEKQAGASPGWERREAASPHHDHLHDYNPRLREGRDHPLHHGHTLHGDHAWDGGNDRRLVDDIEPPRNVNH